MVALKFILTPTASSHVHDLLSCLARFSDGVSFEARQDSLTLSALNLTKSAHASFTLDANFFTTYEFVPDGGHSDGRFTCAISNKVSHRTSVDSNPEAHSVLALLSVFKSRLNDIRASNAIEQCEASICDQPDRLVIQMTCAFGVVKTYKLTYESVNVMHALFDRHTATNQWSIKSSILREIVEYFSPKTEQLDIYHEDDKLTFLSFTEAVVGTKNEILKQPVKTAVILNVGDFEEVRAQEKLHTIISVKDFKAIVTHSNALDTTLNAYYSSPGRPLQFNYRKGELYCQFTVMTAGDNRKSPTASTTTTTAASSRRPTVQPQNTKFEQRQAGSRSMQPPARPEARRNTQSLGKRTSTSTSTGSDSQAQESDSLFVPADDGDRQWDPQNLVDNEESVGWDASEDTGNASRPGIRDTRSVPKSRVEDSIEGLPPTQRLSQVQGGLW